MNRKSKKNKKTDTVEDLKKFISENFNGNNDIKFFISERGNQRIEIKDLDTNEVWHTLEAVAPAENLEDYNDIASAIISGIIQQIEMEEK